MPLIKGSSRKAISENIKTEMKSKPRDQAIAIALDVARRAKRASGGGVDEDDMPSVPGIVVRDPTDDVIEREVAPKEPKRTFLERVVRFGMPEETNRDMDEVAARLKLQRPSQMVSELPIGPLAAIPKMFHVPDSAKAVGAFGVGTTMGGAELNAEDGKPRNPDIVERFGSGLSSFGGDVSRMFGEVADRVGGRDQFTPMSREDYFKDKRTTRKTLEQIIADEQEKVRQDPKFGELGRNAQNARLNQAQTRAEGIYKQSQGSIGAEDSRLQSDYDKYVANLKDQRREHFDKSWQERFPTVATALGVSAWALPALLARRGFNKIASEGDSLITAAREARAAGNVTAEAAALKELEAWSNSAAVRNAAVAAKTSLIPMEIRTGGNAWDSTFLPDDSGAKKRGAEHVSKTFGGHGLGSMLEEWGPSLLTGLTMSATGSLGAKPAPYNAAATERSYLSGQGIDASKSPDEISRALAIARAESNNANAELQKSFTRRELADQERRGAIASGAQQQQRQIGADQQRQSGAQLADEAAGLEAGAGKGPMGSRPASPEAGPVSGAQTAQGAEPGLMDRIRQNRELGDRLRADADVASQAGQGAGAKTKKTSQTLLDNPTPTKRQPPLNKKGHETLTSATDDLLDQGILPADFTPKMYQDRMSSVKIAPEAIDRRIDELRSVQYALEAAGIKDPTPAQIKEAFSVLREKGLLPPPKRASGGQVEREHHSHFQPRKVGRFAGGPVYHGAKDSPKLERKAKGVDVESALATARKYAHGGAVHAGPVPGETGGRADKLPIDVEAGSYVMPADVVSALGGGNSEAGYANLNKTFGESTPRLARGGAAVPIKISHGEYVVPPETVARIGKGDMEMGHRTLDKFVLGVRKQNIHKLSKLPPPAR